MSNELNIPPPADTEPDAHELLRVWRYSEGECVSLDVDPKLDPGAWGIILVDLARHVARAYTQRGIGSDRDNYARVLAGLIAELRSPSAGSD